MDHGWCPPLLTKRSHLLSRYSAILEHERSPDNLEWGKVKGDIWCRLWVILRGWGQTCVTRHTLVRWLSEKGERGSKAVISENGSHLPFRGRKSLAMLDHGVVWSRAEFCFWCLMVYLRPSDSSSLVTTPVLLGLVFLSVDHFYWVELYFLSPLVGVAEFQGRGLWKEQCAFWGVRVDNIPQGLTQELTHYLLSFLFWGEKETFPK